MNTRNYSRMLASALGLAIAAMPASAAVITNLSFDTLPSAQGWTLDQVGSHASVVESDAFSVTGTSLRQNMIGTANSSEVGGRMSYIYFTDPALAVEPVLSLFFTTAVTAHEQTRQDLSWAAHLFSIVHNGQMAQVGIKPGELYSNGTYFTPVGFDGTIQNSYNLTLDTSNNTYEFHWNGQSVRSGSSISSPSLSGVYTMDGTGTANANAEVTQLTAVVGTVVPEPSSALLLATSLGLALTRRRR